MKTYNKLLAFLLVLLLGCTKTSQSVLDQKIASTENGDSLMIVDCLLPAQVRKLGQLGVFATARRPIKSTASECEIRGGEYVAYDRSNYATALKVWLPKAQAGEPEAQAYVGEIYEKGLGLTPNYQVAAQWYGKAAEQGNTRAQINLGYLYERGLGVNKDLAKAMSWYQKSSGLEKLDLPYAATIETSSKNELSKEIQFLKTELKNSRNEAKNLTSQLEKIHDQLKQRQQSIVVSNDALVETQQLLKKATEQANQTEIARLESVAFKKQQEIKTQQQSVVQLKQQYQGKFENLKTKLDETEKRANQFADDLKRQKTVASDAQLKLLNTQAQLASTEKRLLDLKRIAPTKTDRLAKQNTIAEKKAEILLSKKTKEHQGAIARLQKSQEKLAGQEKLISQLESEKSQYAQTIKQLQKQVDRENFADKPKIEIIDPPFVLVRGMPTVTLRSMVKKRDIIGKVSTTNELLSFMVNDQKNEVDDQGLFQTSIKLTDTETPVEVVAIDSNGSRASLDFILSLGKAMKMNQRTTEKLPRVKIDQPWRSLDFGQYYALVIGNNNYKTLPTLDTPINDSTAVAKILKKKYGFKTKVLQNANRYQILSELNKLRAKLNEKDNLLVYYAGHGELDKVNMRGHWLPVDADADNTANWISTVAVTDILNSMSVKHVMVVSDSCYSGAMTRSSLARIEAGTDSGKKSEWLKAMLKARSRTVLTSGGLKPVMDGGGGQHSVFANAFIKALNGNDTLLEGQTLYRKVSAGIVAIAAEYGIEQVPEYAPIRHAGHESGEFFFVPRKL